MKKKISFFILGLSLGGVFLAGFILSSSLREKGYRLKEWFKRPPSSPELEEVVLYFTRPGIEGLVPEKRKIPATSLSSERAKKILRELIKGPTSSSLRPTLPSQSEVRAVFIKGKTIYVDFTSSLRKYHWGGSTGEIITLYSIVNTLLENFPSLSQVQILMEGKPQETLVGHVDISQPLSFNRELIKK